MKVPSSSDSRFGFSLAVVPKRPFLAECCRIVEKRFVRFAALLPLSHRDAIARCGHMLVVAVLHLDRRVERLPFDDIFRKVLRVVRAANLPKVGG